MNEELEEPWALGTHLYSPPTSATGREGRLTLSRLECLWSGSIGRRRESHLMRGHVFFLGKQTLHNKASVPHSVRILTQMEKYAYEPSLNA